MNHIKQLISKHVNYFEVKESLDNTFVVIVPILKNPKLFLSKNRATLSSLIKSTVDDLACIRFFLI